MKTMYRVWLTFLTIALAVLLESCSLHMNGEGSETRKQAKLRISEGQLKTNRYSGLGISIALPKDALNIDVWDQKSYEKDTGHKKLDFVLGKITPEFEPGLEEFPIWRGYVNVFTSQQFDDWTAAGHDTEGWVDQGHPTAQLFNQIRAQVRAEKYRGFDEKAFRIDRRAGNGRVLQALILRSEYTDNPAQREKDYQLITNILQSATFLP